jgi:hypothetical protein
MEKTFRSPRFLKIYTNETHCNKIIHVLVEVNNHIVEELIDNETFDVNYVDYVKDKTKIQLEKK